MTVNTLSISFSWDGRVGKVLTNTHPTAVLTLPSVCVFCSVRDAILHDTVLQKSCSSGSTFPYWLDDEETSSSDTQPFEVDVTEGDGQLQSSTLSAYVEYV